ncbi:MAG: bis(5'-nucleosyl)-tetraphosphatase [Oscillospiraceae bacterium]|nr:bis(5'-nucleosyl)-tetraphosphatase [Oscillospiraceae bacterium]
MESNMAENLIQLQASLGKYVRVRVTHPLGSPMPERGGRYELNYGELVGLFGGGCRPEGVFIIGMHHPVRNFDGRVIALALHRDGRHYAVAAPRKSRYIEGQIRRALRFAFDEGSFRCLCLYERSCGAVVFRRFPGEIRFLLIKNLRSAHWAFPKGHVEDGESAEQTARREVLEETGLHIRILPGFSCQSEYVIQGRVEKSVTIFLAETGDRKTTIQQDEIEDYIWLSYTRAMQMLKFENDRSILRRAQGYLKRNGILSQPI